VKASDFFTLPPSLVRFTAHFSPELAPWEWVSRIEAALASLGVYQALPPVPDGVHISGKVYLAPGVKLPPYAVIAGPAWIGPGTEIRAGAFIRGNVIVGANCVLGNSCEFKNCLLMDRVETPHFNYVGDSILGNDSHLAAGVICSNLRLDKKTVRIRASDSVYDTGLRKLGAMVGDGAEVGCNAVLNPGALLGRRSFVSPAIAFGGYLPPETLVRSDRRLMQVPRVD
jgi:NDP-sugar pyrophosphorylase family protein